MKQLTSTLLTEPGWAGYALLDSGAGRKLERFGALVVDRPEPQALWMPSLPRGDWDAAQAVFRNASDREEDDTGQWDTSLPPDKVEPVKVEGVTMACRLMRFRHMGLFPEQRPHWQWMAQRIGAAPKPFRLLNLFAYTGAASLIAAKCGAEVTHVDASKKAIGWCRDNQTLSNLEDKPIRWICEDAAKFVAREVRRGKTYHGILLDPPKFGRGPNKEVWRFEEHTAPLLADCAALLDKDASFMILTAYALRFSPLSLGNMMTQAVDGRGGQVDCGELAIAPEGGSDAALPLPTSLFARWAQASES